MDWRNGFRKHGTRTRIWPAIDAGDHVVATRAFVSLTTDRGNDDGGGYRVMERVLSVTAQRNQMLADALAELKVFQQKYAGLKELGGVFAAMRSVRADRR